MNTLIRNRIVELESSLAKITFEQGAVAFFLPQLSLVRKALSDIRNNREGAGFVDQDEEIDFYKVAMPAVLQLEVFYSDLHDLYIEKANLSPPQFKKYVKAELKEVGRFFERRRELYSYYLNGSRHLDTLYFTERTQFYQLYDIKICTTYTMLLSELLGRDRYRRELYREAGVSGTGAIEERPTEGSNVEVLLSDADLVEIIPAVHRLKIIKVDGKDVTQDWLIDIVERALGRDLKKNFSTIDVKNRLRKKTITPFLSGLVDAYVQRSQDLLK